MSAAEQTNVPHSAKKAGFAAKRERIKEKVAKGEAQASGQHQKRAFGVANLGRSKRMAQRNADRSHRKEVAPATDRTEKDAPPPVLVAVVGPPNSGKSTLIRSLVKLYTRHNLVNIDGPITVVSAKDRRLTFIEVPDDLTAMIDVGKVADLVLLMIDASFGFEMMTFEFLNILQTHGFPKVCGVLTHMDKMKTNKALQKTKRTLKHRFWTDIYAGAKMFYVGGVLRSGKYPRNEMRQLALYVGRAKFRPLSWRNSHAYMVADRIEDVSPSNSDSDSRDVMFYGYLRGAHLKAGRLVHVPGLGDFVPTEIAALDDPVPIMKQKEENQSLQSNNKKAKALLYAPMAQIGNLHYGDDDDVYIDLRTVAYTREDQLVGLRANDEVPRGEALGEDGVKLKALQDDSMDLKMADSQMQVFGGGQAFTASDLLLDQDEESEEEDSDDEDSDDEDLADEEEYDEDEGDYGKSAVLAEAKAGYERRAAMGNMRDLGPLVYADSDVEVEEDEDEEDKEEDDLLFRRGTRQISSVTKRSSANLNEADDDGEAVAFSGPLLSERESGEEEYDALRDLFVSKDEEDDELVEGDFEELDKDEEQEEEDDEMTSDREKNAALKEAVQMEAAKTVSASSLKQDEDADESFAEDARRKMGMQRERTQREFSSDRDRLAFEGFRNGLYVRVRLSGVSGEFMRLRDATRPVLVCGLQAHEAAAPSLIHARVKRHRWHAKVLKTRDPVVFSCGWRRFQSVPLYCIEDRAEKRHRYLKYTPEHMHCGATFYAPSVPPNSALMAFHTLRRGAKQFRVALLGTVLQAQATSQITKKLKLCGTPYKIERKTAFIEGMFTSALEAARFEGAAIKTVSGLRGIIKKALRDPDQGLSTDKSANNRVKAGAYRATFEDLPLLSDIVICRVWVPVEPPKFCAPVLSHLAPATYLPTRKTTAAIKEQKKDDDSSSDEEQSEEEVEEIVEEAAINEDSLLPMRTVAQIRRAENIPIPFNADSVYDLNAIHRPEKRQFAPHRLPKKLVDSLPFAAKPKNVAPKSKKRNKAAGYLERRKTGPLAQPREPKEKKAGRLLQALSTIRNAKAETRGANQKKKNLEHAKTVDRKRKLAEPRKKEAAQREHAKKGADEARKRAKFAKGTAD